jgi:hypothetical protein
MILPMNRPQGRTSRAATGYWEIRLAARAVLPQFQEVHGRNARNLVPGWSDSEPRPLTASCFARFLLFNTSDTAKLLAHEGH